MKNLLRLHTGKIPVAWINPSANAPMFILYELKDIPFGEWLKTKRDYEQHINNYSITHKICPVQKKIEIVLTYVQIESKYLKYRFDTI